MYTYRTLRGQGYTGDICIVLDSTDPTIDDYRERYENVVVFDKSGGTGTDPCNNFKDLKGVVYARNALYQIAREHGCQYPIVLDDDYVRFSLKFDREYTFIESPVKNLDELFAAHVEFVQQTGAAALCMAQTGDYIGGANGGFGKRVTLFRKGMNVWFLNTNNPISFMGQINEDANAYVSEGAKGKLIFTYNGACVLQKQTQANAGGLTELYLATGTYVKSFYSVMVAPSCVKVAEMGQRFRRLHHSIDWKCTVPKILHERHRKCEGVEIG